MRTRVVALLASAIALGVSADSKYWKGGDGDWASAASWRSDSLPGPTDLAYFTHGTKFIPAEEKPSTAMLGQNVYLGRLYVAEDSGAGIEPTIPDTCRVLLTGLGSLYLQDAMSQVSVGRELTFDHLNVVFTAHSGQSSGNARFSANGYVTFNGGSLSMLDTSSCTLAVDANGMLTVRDGAKIDVARTIFTETGRLRLLDGTCRFGSSSANAFVATNVVVERAFVETGTGNQVNTMAFVPTEPDGVLAVQAVSYHTLEPTVFPAEPMPWRGTVMVTNFTAGGSTSSQVNFKDDMAFYGRGRFYVSELLLSPDKTLDLDLSEIFVGKALRTPNNSGAIYRLHDLCFRSIDLSTKQERKAWTVNDAPFLNFSGVTGIDVKDCRTGDRYALNIPGYFAERSSLEAMGGDSGTNGTVTLQFRQLPTRFASATVREGTVLAVSSKDSETPLVPTRVVDLTLEADAQLKPGESREYVEALGTVNLDATAQIPAPYPAGIDKARPEDVTTIIPVFCSLDDKPAGTIGYARAAWQKKTHWVGGTAYFSNGNQTYPYEGAYGYWLGSEDDKWSNANNWSRRTVYSSGTVAASFEGETNTIVDNDLDNLSVLRLQQLRKSAPFILKGKPITVTQDTFVYLTPATDVPRIEAAVGNLAPFPFVVESQVRSEKSVLGVATAHAEGLGVVALKGGVDAPAATLIAGGTVALGGTVNVREVVLSNAFTAARTRLDRADPSFRSTLFLRKGCSMSVSDQTAANAATGTFWIAKGAEMKVTGPWNWNGISNEHQVDGLLELDGTVGGTAAQGYFGKGVLKVKATDGTGGASIRVGDGLTVVPTSSTWGTMPLVTVYDATVSNETDVALDGGIVISKPGRALAFAGAGETTVSAPITGSVFDLFVRKGTGRLVLDASAAPLAKFGSRVFLESGTLALCRPLSVAQFNAQPGTTLALGSSDGELVSLTVDHDVDLDGLTITAADAKSEKLLTSKFGTVLTVSRFCEITGLPTVEGGGKLKIVENADGTKSLKAKRSSGMILIFR